MDPLVHMIFQVQDQQLAWDLYTLTVCSVALIWSLTALFMETDTVRIERNWLNACLAAHRDACEETYVVPHQTVRYMLVMICCVGLALSTPRILLRFLRSIGFTRRGLDRRNRSFAYRLHRWAARRNCRFILSYVGRLEVVGNLGWKMSTGMMLMAIGGCVGYYAGKLATGLML